MILIGVLLTIALLASFAYSWWQSHQIAQERETFATERRELRTSMEREREGWQAERSELLNRIQHPEFLPSADSPGLPDEDLRTIEPDEIDLVGTIQLNGTNED